MATLTSDITADQTVIGVTGSSRTTGNYSFRIDDELMDLQGFPKYELRGGYRHAGVDHSRWIVTRAVGGSTAATHSAGDTIKGVTSALVSSESETPPAPWAGESGGAQTVRLLGPFTVNFDDVNFINANDNGIPTLDIPAGALVVKVVPVVVTDPIGNEAGDALYLNLLTAANGSGPALGAWDVHESAVIDAAVGLEEMQPFSVLEPDLGTNVPSSQYLPAAAFAVDDCSIYANIGAGGTITAGAWDIYALIAEPAA